MFVFPYLLGTPLFFVCPRDVRFQLPACFRRQGRRRVFLGYARSGGGFPGLIGSCAFCLLPVWYYGMVLIPLSFLLLLLSVCSMARGQEETSTSQVGCRRGPSRNTPSAKQPHFLFVRGGVEVLLSNS